MASTLALVFKRLYLKGEITKEDVEERVKSGKITKKIISISQARRTMNNLAEIVENQNVIISIQSGVIKDLFNLLSQYMTAEEMDTLPQVDKINIAARLTTKV